MVRVGVSTLKEDAAFPEAEKGCVDSAIPRSKADSCMKMEHGAPETAVSHSMRHQLMDQRGGEEEEEGCGRGEGGGEEGKVRATKVRRRYGLKSVTGTIAAP